LTRFYNWLRFWVLWIISSGLNFMILFTIRQFYMTDDLHSDYFKTVAGPIDNWVAFIGIFFCVLLIYLLNAFYKEAELIKARFVFVSSLQLLLLGIFRLATAPFALKFDATFQLTHGYILVSIGALVLSVVLLWLTARNNNESMLGMIKRLMRIHRDNKYW